MPEVQDIFRQYGNDYINRYNPPSHICKVIRAITNCRTSELGSHMDVCEKCGWTKTSYNSCRNRNCPKCQALEKERWVMARQAELLPVPYFHVVFTLPSELDLITMYNQSVIYNLLFKASAETLKELAADGKYLGAEIGFISVLHTWGQTLTLHPHVHMIVPGGGLTSDQKWKNSRKKFFIPVKVMGRKFRGKFLAMFKQIKLCQNGSMEYREDLQLLERVIASLYAKEWYVYCKSPFKTTSSVLEYLGRYTHRVAISNHRILSCDNDIVSFKYRDYNDNNLQKVMSLTAVEFMRRFLLHVLPYGFTKIRHYGILGSAVKTAKIALCDELLRFSRIYQPQLTTVDLIQKLTGIDITRCPVCGAVLARAAPNLN